jgi:hypothetical protein
MGHNNGISCALKLLDRMGQRFALLLSVFLAFASVEARADTDGSSLLKWCQSKNANDHAVCNTYIRAIVDVLESRAAIFNYRACISVTATQAQESWRISSNELTISNTALPV